MRLPSGDAVTPCGSARPLASVSGVHADWASARTAARLTADAVTMQTPADLTIDRVTLFMWCLPSVSGPLNPFEPPLPYGPERGPEALIRRQILHDR
jgi:hypothetical protein